MWMRYIPIYSKQAHLQQLFVPVLLVQTLCRWLWKQHTVRLLYYRYYTKTTEHEECKWKRTGLKTSPLVSLQEIILLYINKLKENMMSTYSPYLLVQKVEEVSLSARVCLYWGGCWHWGFEAERGTALHDLCCWMETLHSPETHQGKTRRKPM